MSFKKIAAHYELMKLADAFQGLVKKFADEQQVGQATRPEPVNVKFVSPRARKIMKDAGKAARKAIHARYNVSYTEGAGNTKYSLKPEFRSQYRQVPPGPSADPYYPFSVMFSSGASILIDGGQYQATGYDSYVILDVKPSVKDPALFIQNLDIVALRNEVAAYITRGLIKQGKLSEGKVIPVNIVEIRVNGKPVLPGQPRA